MFSSQISTCHHAFPFLGNPSWSGGLNTWGNLINLTLCYLFCSPFFAHEEAGKLNNRTELEHLLQFIFTFSLEPGALGAKSVLRAWINHDRMKLGLNVVCVLCTRRTSRGLPAALSIYCEYELAIWNFRSLIVTLKSLALILLGLNSVSKCRRQRAHLSVQFSLLTHMLYFVMTISKEFVSMSLELRTSLIRNAIPLLAQCVPYSGLR